MSGNVAEWTRTLSRRYKYNLYDRREDIDQVGTRVLRGGAFYRESEHVRCTFREEQLPETADLFTGFRLTITPID